MSDLQTQYNRVIEWNTVAGKTKDAYTDSDQFNQIGRVQEEVNEYNTNLYDYRSKPLDRAFYIQLLDDICDVFVTGSFLNEMLGGIYTDVSVDNSLEVEKLFAYLRRDDTLSHYEGSLTGAYGFVKALSLQQDILGLDILGGLQAVNDNNFDKFLDPEDTYRIVATIDMYNEMGENIYIHENKDYVVFKRKQDDKVMKPYGFKSVNLDPFITIDI